MDDLEKAIFFSFDQAVEANLKAQAISFCQQSKQSPTIVQACLEKLRFSQYVEVQFWCLQSLEEVLKHRYASVGTQERLVIRTSLMSAVCNYDMNEDTKPSFVRNKLAQVIVLLIGIEYPSEWPSVFLDLISFLSKGPLVVDMFCRILISLDEEIISLDYPRTPSEQSVATRIKDAMRQQCTSQIAGAWYNLVMMYRKGSRPDLAASVLETMNRYIPWIDIGLVANDSFIPLLFEIIVTPQDAAQLRAAAVDCLLSVISKRMDATAKLSLLQQLHLGHICGRVMEQHEPEFASKFSALLTGFAAEILECGKKWNEGMTAGMLDEILPSVFYFMQNDDEEISSSIFQFLSNYVNRMKSTAVINGQQVVHIGQILEVLRYRMRYNPEFKDALDNADMNGRDEEERMGDYRKELFSLFRNIYKVAPEVTKSFVKTVLASFLGKPDTPFEEVEAGVSLFYAIGEGIPEDVFKSNSGDIHEMFGALLTVSVPCSTHRVVALIYLETIVRYLKLLHYHEEYIPAALGAFLDSRGIHHSNATVNSRASYLFVRLVKALRLQLLPYVDDILQSVQDTLTITAYAKKSTKGGPAEDRGYIFEAVGLLIGLEELRQDKQESFLSSLLVPLYSQVDSILATNVSLADGGQPINVATLQQIIHAISYLSKGFNEQLIVNSRPNLGNMFRQSIDVVLRILVAYPRADVLRSKIISFLHRMVDILGSSVFPYLPTAIQQLLSQSEVKDLVEFLQLINQLMYKFKVGMKGILQEVFPAVVDRLFGLMPKNSFPEGPESHTEEMRELQELQRVFFAFLHAVTLHDLSSVLLLQSSQILNDIIQLLLQSACAHKDVLVRKTCVQVLCKLVLDWCGNASAGEKVPGFDRFMFDRFAADCCVLSALQSSFNLCDANTVSLMGEIAAAQKALYEKCGEEFLMKMATQILPAAHCPPIMAEQYCLQIKCSEPKDLKVFYRNFIEKLRPQYNSNRTR